MPDAPAAQAPAVTPGNQTSEFSMTKLIVLIGAVVQVAGFALSYMPDTRWTGVAAIAIGGAMSLLKGLGYTNSRTALKLAALEKAAADVASDAGAAPKRADPTTAAAAPTAPTGSAT